MSDAPAEAERGPGAAALLVGALLLGLAAAVAWDAFTLRTGVATYSRVGPEVFPYAIAVGLAALGIGTMVSGTRHPVHLVESVKLGPVAWIIGGLAAQLALIGFTGFSIATGIVFAATAAGFGRFRLWLSYPAGVLFALIVWLIFALALKLVLPAGPLEHAAAPWVGWFVTIIVDEARRLIDLGRVVLTGG